MPQALRIAGKGPVDAFSFSLSASALSTAEGTFSLGAKFSFVFPKIIHEELEHRISSVKKRTEILFTDFQH
jgi:hypothetical protein